ncbi:hypothetical protein AB0O67_33935 [Streptomyces sp. NPDC086077]|uniref:hypothetical protein n=1 Tax=Streptomyces sp. NPDC086077 TaxID=3154862 RepID=UPI003432A85F
MREPKVRGVLRAAEPAAGSAAPARWSGPRPDPPYFGTGSESEVEVGGKEPSAWDVKLQPEDFLPKDDLDVSGVPTADELDP